MEKEAVLETVPFGTLCFPVEEGLGRELPLVLDDRPLTVGLSIAEGLARPERQEALVTMLNAVPELYRETKERILRDYETDPEISGYIQRRIEELGGEEDLFSMAIDFTALEVMSPQKVFAAELELRGVFFRPAKGESFYCALIFHHEPDLFSEYLVIRFDPEQRFIDIATIEIGGERNG